MKKYCLSCGKELRSTKSRHLFLPNGTKTAQVYYECDCGATAYIEWSADGKILEVKFSANKSQKQTPQVNNEENTDLCKSGI